MPCIPSWEERMVMNADHIDRILAQDYPQWFEQYRDMLSLLERLNLFVPSKSFLELKELRKTLPHRLIPPKGRYPTREEGKQLENYAKAAQEHIDALEEWCFLHQVLLNFQRATNNYGSRLIFELVLWIIHVG